jgi:hypothetical protein
MVRRARVAFHLLQMGLAAAVAGAFYSFGFQVSPFLALAVFAALVIVSWRFVHTRWYHFAYRRLVRQLDAGQIAEARATLRDLRPLYHSRRATEHFQLH